MQTRPIAEGLFVSEPAPRLIGGRCNDDGHVVFPMPSGPDGAAYQPVMLKTEGKLWSFTVQRFRPKSPPYAGADTEQTFKPYALGYVELEGEVIVESRIQTVEFETLRVGQTMRLVLQPFGRDADGTIVVTFAFEPLETDLGAAA